MSLQCCLLLLVAASYTAAKDLCCLSEQFEMSVATNSVQRKGQLSSFVCKSSADYASRNMVSSDCQIYLPNRSQFRMIQDLSGRRAYYVDEAKRTCVNTTLVESPKRCIPDGKKAMDFYFGEPSQPFETESFAVDYNGVTVYIGLHQSAKVNQCTLVSATVVKQASFSLLNSGYFNYTMGISDPSVFDIPSYCNGDGTLKFHMGYITSSKDTSMKHGVVTVRSQIPLCKRSHGGTKRCLISNDRLHGYTEKIIGAQSITDIQDVSHSHHPRPPVPVQGKAKFCCFPAQWEGEEGFTTGSSDDEGHTALNVGNAKVSYDVTGQRSLLDQRLQSGNETREYQIL